MGSLSVRPFDLFSELDRALFSGLRPMQHQEEDKWVPAVDVHEESDRYLIKVDVPGIEPKDVELSLEDNVLTIRGERSTEQSEKKDGVLRRERRSGVFLRRLQLPDNIDVDSVKAEGKHGVLEISLPKQERVKPRRISVS